MTTTRVCVLDDWEGSLQRADWSAVQGRIELDVHSAHIADPAGVIEAIGTADVLVVMRERTPVTGDLIAACPRLRLIVTTGARNGAIDVAAAAQHDVLVCGTGPGTGPVVELAWALILTQLRRLPQAHEVMAGGGWATEPGQELRGRTLGLLGLGRTGARMAGIARAFGMDVCAWSPNLTPERAADHEVRLVTRDELFRSADVLSVHLVLAPTTRGIVGGREIALMKPRALLVNTSRGALVDESALIAACESGAIAGAMVDVYSEEPLPPHHPMRRTPGLLATPHIGYVTDENLDSWAGDVVDSVAAWLDGAPVRVISA